jgi:hypothetical protein
VLTPQLLDKLNIRPQAESALRDQLWLAGSLRWKLMEYQDGLYDEITGSNSLKYVVNCSRRFGKSFILSLFAFEFALKNKNVHIRFAAPTQKQLKEIITPIFEKIALDAPKQVKPTWKQMESHFYFPSSNSFIHVAGCDNGRLENLRGHESHLNIIDEAGTIDELEYLIKDILLPQTLTTGGKTYIASTPPPTPAHYFHQLAIEAQNKGYYSKYTINDNTSLDPVLKAEYARESGGEESTTWKREYLCQFVVDENRVIIPEWKRDFIQARERDEFYKFYQCYASMDIGGRDKTAILFGYYDYRKASLIVEHELIFEGRDTTTKLIAEEIRAIESAHYPEKTVKRWSDNNAVIMVQDLQLEHRIAFNPTSKDLLQAMINEVRLFVGAGRLIVNPRCTELLGCLESAVWNKQRSEFERSSLYGHYDALASLVYLIRNIDQSTNPVPHDFGFNKHETFGLERLKEKQISYSNLKRAFKK